MIFFEVIYGMALILDALVGILNEPTIGGMVAELAVLAALLWVAVLVGMFVGWVWRPRWAVDLAGGMGTPVLSNSDSLNDSAADESCESCEKEEKSETLAVTIEDLDHLCKLVEVRDGGPEWRQMMDKSLPNMSYQACRRDAEVRF